MAQGAHAHLGYVGVGFAGMTDLRQAAVTRTLFQRFHTWESQHSRNEEIDPTSGRSEPESVSLGDYDLKFQGVLEGSVEGCIPAMARSLMGAAFVDSVVGTTGQQHLLEPADTVPNNARLTIEERYGTDAESLVYNGLVTKLGFNLNQAGYARWDVAGVGSSPAYSATPTAAVLPNPSTLLAQRVTTFSLDSQTATVVRNLRWDVERKIDDKDFDVTSQHRRDASYGEFMATFDAEITFQNMVEFRRFWGGATAIVPGATEAYFPVNIKTERSDVIAGGTAKCTAEIDLPKAFITKVGSQMGGRDVIKQRIQGHGIYDPTGTYSARLKFINGVASY